MLMLGYFRKDKGEPVFPEALCAFVEIDLRQPLETPDGAHP
jgi:hypothetical protein